ncbi:fibrous sheath-interacting protein 2-like [Grus americana]|uniref:fibrous sheath-interacting protein 2-like n=1 Tax=Grus americana TaxID=9117 RepID=UPI00240877DC|nr:fibrous sheath-interacting protein 2-like [Grus americana]XP_054667782.1 fibrous sheath-interacting protein 2-like [Grus americana]XP_054667783.1 fibrous sheath-interacting protein 2-like [Grus americana]XP_054667784.1 fibrous sheath-interacting protein 2-like [Grus americana]XP_054668133.1 fibrous sheath-interacting protein 2-like [Grus americana]XP_054668134.1 fibrous sheath-interacting protein 2-like [Grus americana]
MEPELLDLPLGVKIPVVPGSKPVFSRAKLGEKLHRPSGYFDLGDPYCRLTSTEYNSLHDPHLQAYYKRKDNLRRLKKEGYVTSDGKVGLGVAGLGKTVPSARGSLSTEAAYAQQQLPSRWVRALSGKAGCVAGLTVLG